MAHKPKKSKVLIVDDDPLVREAVKLALAHAGFDAATLESPELTAAVVKAQRPDAILLDLYMPDHSGLDLCRALKADPETAKVPIVIFTGSSETVDVMAGIQAGAVQYIAKPIDPAALVKKLNEILKRPAGGKQ